METALYLISSIFLLLGCFYFGTKILDWNQKRIVDKYQNNLNHFLSDLYRLQQKWSLAGEMGYSESIGNVIKLHGNVSLDKKLGAVDVPFTNDALSTSIQLKNRRKEEMFNVIQSEFNG